MHGTEVLGSAWKSVCQGLCGRSRVVEVVYEWRSVHCYPTVQAFPLCLAGGSRLDPTGPFVPTNTKQALSNMLQRRSGAVLQPPALHALSSQQQLLQMKLLQQQQRLLRQAQARPFQQVGPPGLEEDCIGEFSALYFIHLHVLSL